MKFLLSLCFLTLVCSASFAQFSIRADVSQEFSIDYKFKDQFRFEIGVMPGEFGTSQLKPSIKADVLKKADFDGYIGLGLVNLDPVEVVSIPLGIDVYPLEKKALSLVLEIENQIGDKYVLVGNLGIRYRFIR